MKRIIPRERISDQNGSFFLLQTPVYARGVMIPDFQIFGDSGSGFGHIKKRNRIQYMYSSDSSFPVMG